MDNKMYVSLSKELRKKYGVRSFPIMKGDTVTIIAGSNRKEGGKVADVDHKENRVIIEGITIAKTDGKQKAFGIAPSNLRITHLDLSKNERIEKIKNLASLKHIEVPDIPEPVPEEKQEEPAKESEQNEQKDADIPELDEEPEDDKKEVDGQ
ncbi:MAG: 50S ribosomal protein L24 [Thermoplasmata archaeon]